MTGLSFAVEKLSSSGDRFPFHYLESSGFSPPAPDGYFVTAPGATLE